MVKMLFVAPKVGSDARKAWFLDGQQQQRQAEDDGCRSPCSSRDAGILIPYDE